MDDASGLGPARDATGRFGPGNPGRQVGSRNRVPRQLALAIFRHFKANETKILNEMLLMPHFNDYIRMIGRMLPSEANDDGPEIEAMAPDEATRVAGQVRAALDRIEAGEGSLAEVQAALDGQAGGQAPTVNYGDSTVARRFWGS